VISKRTTQPVLYIIIVKIKARSDNLLSIMFEKPSYLFTDTFQLRIKRGKENNLHKKKNYMKWQFKSKNYA
jgi:hypothetical protein